MSKMIPYLKKKHPDWKEDKVKAVALKECGLSRSRSYQQDFDYWGIAALGDVQYDDGFDSWNEITAAFKSSEKIPIVRNHNDEHEIGFLSYWELDKCNKKVYIGFNKDDVSVELALFNNVSPEWEIDEEGHIIGVNHIAIGNSFNPKCETEVCNIMKKQRSEPAEGQEEEPVEEPEAPTTEEVEEESEVEILKKQVALLKKELETLKPPEEEKSEPAEEDVKLEPKKDVQHELQGEEVKPMFSRGINIKNITQNG